MGVSGLIRQTTDPMSRTRTTHQSAEPFVPRSTSLAALGAAARDCRGCPLWAPATQTVFGEGRRSAQYLLIGEQPGDQEDRRGRPFVGPAGRILWECLDDAGIERTDVYTTNAVKHFKHEMRGKRRIHKKPDTSEVEACHPWIDAEIRAVRPSVVVVLGATAARSALGRPTPIAASRGQEFEIDRIPTVVTYHPSAVLRADERAAEIRRALVEDLELARRVADRLRPLPGAHPQG
jgi:uracil-DNA glycosylase family protein